MIFFYLLNICFLFHQVVGPVIVKSFPPVFTDTLILSLRKDSYSKNHLYTEWESASFDPYELASGYIGVLEYKTGMCVTVVGVKCKTLWLRNQHSSYLYLCWMFAIVTSVTHDSMYYVSVDVTQGSDLSNFQPVTSSNSVPGLCEWTSPPTCLALPLSLLQWNIHGQHDYKVDLGLCYGL